MTPKLVSTNVPSADDSKSSLLDVLASRFVGGLTSFTKLLGDQFFGDFRYAAAAPAICGVGTRVSVGMRGMGDVPLLVSADDLLHQIVAHDVLFAELDGANAIDLAADFEGFHEARLLSGRQVDLCDVTGDDRLGIKTQARQKHLHLLAGGILRLIENHERIVQRASTHKCQRGDLDNALLQKSLQLVCVEHVVQGVV